MAERNDRVNLIDGSDKAERRKNDDRRQFSYTIHIPERRNGADRRKGIDRRHHARPIRHD